MTTWLQLLRNSQKAELIAILAELNSAAQAIDVRLEVQRIARQLEVAPREPRTDLERHFESAGKNGLGCALIITMAHLLQSLNVGDEEERWKRFERGPMLGDCFWASAIIAAGNYVRHGDEWRRTIDRHNGAAVWTALQVAQTADQVESAFQFLPARTRRDLKRLIRADFRVVDLLYEGACFWRMAEIVRLNNIEFTVRCFEDFLSSEKQSERGDVPAR